MMDTAAGARSYFIDAFTDECTPCPPTLNCWAAWLSQIDNDMPDRPVAVEGQVFAGSAILWQPDIIATWTGDDWQLSREPGEADFVAVRYGEGAGWDAECIIYQEYRFVDGPGSDFVPAETMGQALRRWLLEFGADGAEDVENVAVGTQESGLRLIYRAGPPAALEVVAVQ